jgi:hypothetical protein
LSLPYARHAYAPAIPVLGQPGVLAQLLAALQIMQCGWQIVAFAMEFAYAYVHVCGSPYE